MLRYTNNSNSAPKFNLQRLNKAKWLKFCCASQMSFHPFSHLGFKLENGPTTVKLVSQVLITKIVRLRLENCSVNGPAKFSNQLVCEGKMCYPLKYRPDCNATKAEWSLNIKAQSQAELSYEGLGLHGLSARAAFLSNKSQLLRIFIDIRVIAFPRSKAKDWVFSKSTRSTQNNNQVIQRGF